MLKSIEISTEVKQPLLGPSPPDSKSTLPSSTRETSPLTFPPFSSENFGARRRNGITIDTALTSMSLLHGIGHVRKSFFDQKEPRTKQY